MRTYTITAYEKEDYDNFEKSLSDAEAALILEYIKRGYIPDYNYDMDEDDFERFKLHTAMSRAIRKLRQNKK